MRARHAHGSVVSVRVDVGDEVVAMNDDGRGLPEAPARSGLEQPGQARDRPWGHLRDRARRRWWDPVAVGGAPPPRVRDLGPCDFGSVRERLRA